MLPHYGFYQRHNFFEFGKGERDHENYGITHTIKHVLLMRKKNLLLKYYKFECRSCGNLDLKSCLLGYQPLANNLLKKEKEKCELYLRSKLL